MAVPIYNLQLDGADYIILTKGTSTTIKLKIVPIHTTNKNINWKSSNEEVAVVQDGMITAVAVGNAVITAVSDSDPEKKVEIRVRVNSISVEKIELNVASPTLMDPDEVLQLTATVHPVVAPQELDWTSSDETIATVTSEGKVTALKPGDVIISATSASDKSKSASIRITVRGLEENILDNKKFVALPHSSQFQFSPYGTSDLSTLWNNNSTSLGTKDIFYISNKTVTYFGIDLGVKAKLTSLRYWGRADNYFVLRHPKTIEIYGTNDAAVAKNPNSPDEDWILLTETPFESVRPSGGTDKPVAGDIDYVYASEGERIPFTSTVPAVQYVRFKCLKTWGNIEGVWGTEISFNGTVIP
ncbi:Ig-like domain-containing protein [Sphingobacterium athyrii]|uniref:Ig-like domain-containing protein n=1 Tax=Sphingobacterium athyrii TaxID=2152717 RepID=UPI001C63AC1B|nr:Ig-like domain-containing protein [Sphingobacterium athyrii]